MQLNLKYCVFCPREEYFKTKVPRQTSRITEVRVLFIL